MIPVVIAGYSYDYIPLNAKVVYPERPLMPQLTGFAEFPAEVVHPNNRDEGFDKALKEIQEGYLVAQLASNTINKNLYEGCYNSIHNYAGVMGAGRLESGQVKDTVYIVGNGCSKSGVEYPDDATVMTCWHAMTAVKRYDYVAHMDALFSEAWGVPDSSATLISTPTAAKEFWRFDNPHLLYLDNAPECHAWIELFGYQHPKVDGSVVHMMTQAAILMGAKEIHFTGLDFGYATLDEAVASGYDGFYDKPNKAGNAWYTTFIFDVFKDGIEKIVSLNPGVPFVNHSVGLSIQGVDV